MEWKLSNWHDQLCVMSESQYFSDRLFIAMCADSRMVVGWNTLL